MRLRFWLCALVCPLFAAPVWADAIPYAAYGSVAPTVGLVASSTGHVSGYLYGSDAGGTDYVRLVDTTSGYKSLFLLSNHGPQGTQVDFGPVAAGDVLVFQLVNSDVEGNKDGTDFTHAGEPFDPNAQENGYLMASQPALSLDGYNHAYVTAFSGSDALGIPAGIYLGMEDLPFAAADLDYNDTQFVFSNVSATSVTPEPGSLLLLATGGFGLAGVSRRRLVRGTAR